VVGSREEVVDEDVLEIVEGDVELADVDGEA